MHSFFVRLLVETSTRASTGESKKSSCTSVATSSISRDEVRYQFAINSQSIRCQFALNEFLQKIKPGPIGPGPGAPPRDQALCGAPF